MEKSHIRTDHLDNTLTKPRDNSSKDFNIKNSKKDPPLLTKGMAISFGFKKRVPSAPITKIPHPTTTLDNSIYNTDRNANKFNTDTKTTRTFRQDQARKGTIQRTDENTKPVLRPTTLERNNMNKNNDINMQTLNGFKKPKKDSIPKTVRFSSVDTKQQKHNNGSFGYNANKTKPSPEAISPPANKFTLSTSQLPRPQMPLHVTNLKSSKTALNNNKQKTEQVNKNKLYDPKEIYMTNALYKRFNVKTEISQNQTNSILKEGSHINKSELSIKTDSHINKINTLPKKGNPVPSKHNSPTNEEYYEDKCNFLINQSDVSPNRCDSPPSNRHLSTKRSNISSDGLRSSLSYKTPPPSFESPLLYRSSNRDRFESPSRCSVSSDSFTPSSDGFRNPQNSPQRVNLHLTNIHPSAQKYESTPLSSHLTNGHVCESEDSNPRRDRSVREKTFIKTEVMTKKKEIEEKLFIADNEHLAEKLCDNYWDNAGETMAEDASYSFSSSDESKEKEGCDIQEDKFVSFLEEDLVMIPPASSLNISAKDPIFAAVAKSTDTIGNLLEDESPADSLFCSLSEENGKYENINGKSKNRTPSSKSSPTEEKTSPNTPTNASNSLSLSDGKDFLIDDEIADQPALLFNHNANLPQNESPLGETRRSPVKGKLKKYEYEHYDHSMFLKENKLNKKTSSLDTLSPCDSISSDDLMLNYDNIDTSEGEENEATERETMSNRFPKLKTKSSNFSPKVMGSPIPHSRVTEVKFFDTPKRCSQIDFSESSSYERSHIVCSPDVLRDVSSFKDMLTRLRGVLLEFEAPPMIENAIEGIPKYAEEIHNYKMENSDLRRQIIFLQGQLEDKERALVLLQQKEKQREEVHPPSTLAPITTCNAATQTEKVRPLTASQSFMHISHHKDELGSILR